MKTTIHVEGETGVDRAAKRLAAKRAANRLIPDLGIVTRQQRRWAERQYAKGIPRTDHGVIGGGGTFAYANRVPA